MTERLGFNELTLSRGGWCRQQIRHGVPAEGPPAGA
jgi:hypothetical protein